MWVRKKRDQSIPSRPLSTTEAARVTQWSVPRIKQLLQAGRVRGTKVGRTWVIDSVSLDRYCRHVGRVVNWRAIIGNVYSPTASGRTICERW